MHDPTSGSWHTPWQPQPLHLASCAKRPSEHPPRRMRRGVTAPSTAAPAQLPRVPRARARGRLPLPSRARRGTDAAHQPDQPRAHRPLRQTDRRHRQPPRPQTRRRHRGLVRLLVHRRPPRQAPPRPQAPARRAHRPHRSPSRSRAAPPHLRNRGRPARHGRAAHDHRAGRPLHQELQNAEAAKRASRENIDCNLRNHIVRSSATAPSTNTAPKTSSTS